MRFNQKIISLGFALITLALSAACTSESARTEPVTTTTDKGASTAPPAKEVEQRDKSLVRFIHVLPSFAEVDGFVGTAKEFDKVAYRSVTPYKEIPDNQSMFAIKRAGKDGAQPFAQNDEGISGGKHYTAIAMPATDGKATLHVVSDKLTPTAAGKANVRVVHASPDAGEVDVFVKGQTSSLFSGVNPQAVTNYSDVDPMTVTLEVRPQGAKTVALTIPNVSFEAGHLYTIVVAGKAKGTPKLEAIKIDDKLDGMMNDARPTPAAMR
ncbi:MAG: DUF4397 domain-containing protein [Acidobacteria bacterium]|nr:DUF4397 domain-containing protein [Acidobacteriota bacterium]